MTRSPSATASLFSPWSSLHVTDAVRGLTEKLASICPSWELDIEPLAPEYVFGFGRFLGEYYCRWLTEVMGWQGEAGALQRVTIGTMLLRGVAVLRDYVVDTGSPNERYAIAAADFREAAVELLAGGFQTSRASAAAIIDAHEEESERLDAYERRRHWHRVRPFGERDLWLLGRKTTLCYAPLEILSVHSVKTTVSSLRNAICFRNVAVQILDDISDWRDDLEVGNITLPLWCAMTVMNQTSSSCGSVLSTAEALYGSDAIPVLLDLSRHYIERAVQAIAPYDTPSLAAYFSRLAAHVHGLRTKASKVIRGSHNPSAFTIAPGRAFSTIVVREHFTKAVPANTATIEGFDEILPMFAPRAGVT